MSAYEFGGEGPKVETNSIYVDIEKPEGDGVEPFFEDHLDAIKKAIDILVPVIGSPQSKISIFASGTATPGHCADSDGDMERVTLTIQVLEDLYLDPDLVPEGDQTAVASELYVNALTDEKPKEEGEVENELPEPEDVIENELPDGPPPVGTTLPTPDLPDQELPDEETKSTRRSSKKK